MNARAKSIEPAPAPTRKGPWLTRLAASARFQSWAARFPLTRRRATREGAAMMDLLSGFVQSQSLMALVELGTLEELRGGPLSAAHLGHLSRVPEGRMDLLLRAGVAMGLLKQTRDRYALTIRGASLLGVPGLTDMIRHHKVFYRDLAEPGAFFRGETETELAQFWPYVFGGTGTTPPEEAERYSTLMARSQLLVAEDTLRAVSLRGRRRILDVGGGTGAFLEAVGRAYPQLDLGLFDLPVVVPPAKARFAGAGMAGRVDIHPGSFRDTSLPEGYDVISLVRVCYDHADDTVAALLSKCHGALAPGGLLVVSEPMTGGARPSIAGDVYFQLYTLAMQTGRTRSQDALSRMLEEAGFDSVSAPKTRRNYVTSVVLGQKL